MENQKILVPKPSNNSIITFLFGLVLILTSITANAQFASKSIPPNSSQIVDYQIQIFEVAKIENKLYFKFVVIENMLNTSYTLEYSDNGIDFYTIQLKEGFKSPNGTPLMYCYTVNDLNNFNSKKFRIRRGSKKGVNYSLVING
ncbi:MAG: hypothetical protein COA97_05995 [Flavobacteriales bacterium]|nr:MAG: hypothetical protein COA97_05995 [Flavobacteriales bacterium]